MEADEKVARIRAEKLAATEQAARIEAQRVAAE